MKKVLKTIQLSATRLTNNGVIYVLPDIIIKIITLVTLIYLWRVVIVSGVDVGITVEQMTTYTFTSSVLADMLSVKTPATGWLSEGILLKMYNRPMSVVAQLIAETVGGWIPSLLMFSLPMVLISPLLNVKVTNLSLLFFVSLLLCISLGFAIEILFACLSIKMKNTNWLVSRIRIAITALLSGTIIPINLLPFGLAKLLKYQPFASLGGAPLATLSGMVDGYDIVLLQAAWNLILWPVAIIVFRKSQEGMVSYGG